MPAGLGRGVWERVMRAGLLVFTAAMAMGGEAAAFMLSPVEMTVDPAGSRTSFPVVLDNPSPTPAAIEITVHTRAMSPEGRDVLTADENDFLVMPPQVTLMPGQRQVVRLQWFGGARDRETAYRLIAEQLPAGPGAGASEDGRTRLLVRYVASLYVRPEGAAPDVAARDGRVAVGPDGACRLTFTAVNRGTAHAALRDLTIRTAGAADLEIGPERLAGVTGSVILAGGSRRFAVPLAGRCDGPAAATGPVTVALSYGVR